MIRTGFRSGYWVVEWSDEFDPSLTDLLHRFPEMVRGYRVVIASCDSGPFEPTPADYAEGWVKRGEIVVSPIIDKVSALPTPGFDEWYVYAGNAPDEPHLSFVNRWGFAPLDKLNLEIQDFWAQVERFQPLHIIGAGTPTMFFVTKDESVFQKASSVCCL